MSASSGYESAARQDYGTPSAGVLERKVALMLPGGGSVTGGRVVAAPPTSPGEPPEPDSTWAARRHLTPNQQLTAQILQTLSRPAVPHMSLVPHVPHAPHRDLLRCSYQALALVMLDHTYAEPAQKQPAPPPAPSPVTSAPSAIHAPLVLAAAAPRARSPPPIHAPRPHRPPRSPTRSRSRSRSVSGSHSRSRSRSRSRGGSDTETAPEGEEEEGRTRCVCGFTHDDGYMICCDRCAEWQHVDCVQIDRQNIPDEYQCELCQPRALDRRRARALQLRKREELGALGAAADDGGASRRRLLTVTTYSDTRPPPAPAPAPSAPPPPAPPLAPSVSKRGPRRTRAPPKPPKRKPGERRARRKKEAYEPAATNHYSPELRARLAKCGAGGLQWAGGSTGGRLCAPVPHAGGRILVATRSLRPATPVVELRGKYMLAAQAPPRHKPRPFVFHYRLPRDDTAVCVDARTYGNEARFVRRSCRPNAELRHCLLKGALHLYLVTLGAVPADTEITLGHEPGAPRQPCACGNPRRCRANGLGGPERDDELSASPPAPDAESPPAPASESPPPTVRSPPPRPPSPLVKCEPDEVSVVKTERDSPTETDTPHTTAVATLPALAANTAEDLKEIKEEKKEEKEVKQESPPNIEKESSDSDRSERGSGGSTRSTDARAARALRRSLGHDRSSRSSRNSRHSHTQDSPDESPSSAPSTARHKMTREERKMEAIVRAFERMEKAERRKMEVRERQRRRESDPAPPRKRKGRARTASQGGGGAGGVRRRLDSADSEPATSADEGDMPGPGAARPDELARRLGLSSACLFVEAAVGAVEAGFKLPKTKKAMITEWIARSPDGPAPQPEPHSAKKRWLRQAISEVVSSAPVTVPPAPVALPAVPLHSAPAAPLKKRRLARESLSAEEDSPAKCAIEQPDAAHIRRIIGVPEPEPEPEPPGGPEQESQLDMADLQQKLHSFHTENIQMLRSRNRKSPKEKRKRVNLNFDLNMVDDRVSIRLRPPSPARSEDIPLPLDAEDEQVPGEPPPESIPLPTSPAPPRPTLVDHTAPRRKLSISEYRKRQAASGEPA